MQADKPKNLKLTSKRDFLISAGTCLRKQLAETKDFPNEISVTSCYTEIEDESRIHSPKYCDTHASTNYFAKRIICSPDVSNRLFIRDKASEKKCLMLLQNLISEQIAYRFDSVDFCTDLSQETAIKFRFFLNAMEILAQLLNIINVKNYSYRTKDYGKYEQFLHSFPRKADKGSIITYTNFMATLENPTYIELSSILAVSDPQDSNLQEISNIHKELGFAAAKYHRTFREFLLALNSINKLYEDAVNSKGNKAKQVGDIFTIDGVIDPLTKEKKHCSYREVLSCFERTIREFEQTLIAAQIELAEYRNRWSERSLSKNSVRGAESNSLGMSPSVSFENRGRRYYVNKLGLAVADETSYFSKNSSIFSENSHPRVGGTADVRLSKVTPRNYQQNSVISCFGQQFSDKMPAQQQISRFVHPFSMDITYSNSKEKRLSSDSSNVHSRNNFRFRTEQLGIASGEELPKKIPYITPILKNKDSQGTLPSTDIIRESFNREYWTCINTKVNSRSQQNILKNMLQCQKKIDYKPRDPSNKENEAYNPRKTGRAIENEHSSQEEAKLKKIFKENRFFVGPATSKFIKLR